MDICVVRNTMEVCQMIDNDTIRKLRELNIGEIVDILEVQQKDSVILLYSFDERMKLITDYLYTTKYNSKVQRLINSAKFRFPSADITSIIYESRSIDRSRIVELSTNSYLNNATNIIIQGYTGSGKTYLACALGKEACFKGCRVKYIRLPDLLMAYDEAKTLSAIHLKKFLSKYEKYQLLIIDEWLMEDLSNEEEHFIFELIERRYGISSTIFCTQYKQSEWIELLGSNVHSEAITDRIIHNAITIETGKTNMRELLNTNKN